MEDDSKPDKLDKEVPLKPAPGKRGRPKGVKDDPVKEAGNMAKNALRGRVINFWRKGNSMAAISKEVGVGIPTVKKWLVESGERVAAGAEEPLPLDPKLQKELEDEHNETGRHVVEKDIFDQLNEDATKDVVKALTLQQKQDILTVSAQIAREMEDEAIEEGAQIELSVADQYQAYAANLGIKLLRDNRNLIRGPRTVKELNDLDQFIRRNLGLNPRGETKGAGGGRQGNLIVDVKILNNPQADLVKDKNEEPVIVDLPGG